MGELRECARCGLTFPLAAFQPGIGGLMMTCRDCYPRNGIIIQVALIAANRTLQVVGAVALLDMHCTYGARLVLRGCWPSIRELRVPEQRHG